MKYTPLDNRLIIERDEVKDRSNSGLYLSTTKSELPPSGIVVAVADNIKDIKVGDRVIFNQYGALPLEENQTNETKGLILLLKSHIHAVISESKDE